MPRLLIGGFGPAGAATALALLAGGFNPDDLLIFDREAEAPAGASDQRILAVNAGSRRFLAAIGVWPALEPQAFALRSIALSDSGLEEEVRPLLLGFSPEAGEPLAHLVPLFAIRAALQQACRVAGIPFRRAGFRRATASGGAITVDLAGEGVSAELLIAADGARSPIRADAGIAFYGWAYGQLAITAVIRHSGEHRGEAIQHFLPGGPFALLPLDEGRSSMVWSERTNIARELIASSPERRLAAIEKRAAGARGDILAVEALSAHPLSLGLARRFFAERRALVADSAHIVHPLAGQGLNLGFADAAALAELVVERARLGLDCGAPDLLLAYQARRRPPAVAMAYATEGLNRLFSNDAVPLRLLRDAGLGLVERSPWLKRRFMRIAAGEAGPAPKLFRGEAI